MDEQIQRTIGGYFGLELRKGCPYHAGAIAVNSGRNALEYILRNKPPTKIYTPHFTCTAIFNKITELGIEVENYHIDESMEPIFNFEKIDRNEAFLYTNYFGLKTRYIQSLKTPKCRFIIDNAHSFFSPPVNEFESFYSPRKFFGVPDGGYAFCAYKGNLDQDYSTKRTSHLVMRHDYGAQAGYAAYLENEDLLAKTPIYGMSQLTTRILESIDYIDVAYTRRRNFKKLHDSLCGSNLLSINNDNENVALTYPYLSNNTKIKNKLLENKIFTATYWTDVIRNSRSSNLERHYAEKIVHLPIDQRYGESDMNRILQHINP
jgi:hypothetical protein